MKFFLILALLTTVAFVVAIYRLIREDLRLNPKKKQKESEFIYVPEEDDYEDSPIEIEEGSSTVNEGDDENVAQVAQQEDNRAADDAEADAANGVVVQEDNVNVRVIESMDDIAVGYSEEYTSATIRSAIIDGANSGYNTPRYSDNRLG